jgi:hypothetical protein
MNQPEISEGLSPDHRQLIKDYLTRASEQHDHNAGDLWWQLLLCCQAGAHREPGNVEWIAETYGADTKVGPALAAGLTLINPRTEADWDLFNRSHSRRGWRLATLSLA